MATWTISENLTHDGKSAGSWAVWTNEMRPRYVGEVQHRNDARLIAAAPQMLSALQEAHNLLAQVAAIKPFGQDGHAIQTRIAAAIAAARGVVS